MGLREVGSCLPPGFRFHPSDEELVWHYLYKKVSNKKASEGVTMVEVDLHTQEPWELPEVAKLSANEWYFFSFRDRKYATGSRTNRATKSGYWKATGKDRTVNNHRKHAMIGMRKTLVFYLGRAPNGTKTDWVMHEFRIQIPHSAPKEDWVLCRVFHKKKEERVKEITTNCYTSILPSTLWHSSSPIVLDQTLSSYHEDIHNNSFMEFNPIHDFTYDYNMKVGQNNGNDEHNALLWDTGLENIDDIINLEGVVFLK